MVSIQPSSGQIKLECCLRLCVFVHQSFYITWHTEAHHELEISLSLFLSFCAIVMKNIREREKERGQMEAEEYSHLRLIKINSSTLHTSCPPCTAGPMCVCMRVCACRGSGGCRKKTSLLLSVQCVPNEKLVNAPVPFCASCLLPDTSSYSNTACNTTALHES